MTFLEAAFATYLVLTAVALVMTYREQRHSGPRTVAFNIIGFVACAAWPVMVAAVLLSPRHRES